MNQRLRKTQPRRVPKYTCTAHLTHACAQVRVMALGVVFLRVFLFAVGAFCYALLGIISPLCRLAMACLHWLATFPPLHQPRWGWLMQGWESENLANTYDN